MLARNLRVLRREIDLVVERGELLVAVEVKWRQAGTAFEGAAHAWRSAQRRRTTSAILAAFPSFPRGAERPWRLDLVTLEVEPDGLRLVHHRGAGCGA